MTPYQRVALFIDYENFHTSLQKRSSTLSHSYGFSPKLDFEALVALIEAEYGPSMPHDLVVVANFTHYDPQKGGLNRAARVIDVDSFEIRQVRSEIQSSPGKKFVIDNYADMRLAFEIGEHAARDPAELYILCTGDKAFTAVARALQDYGYDVLFLVPDPSTTARIIKEHFKYRAYEDLPLPVAGPPALEEPQAPREPKKNQPVDVLCNVVSILRQEFSTPIPITLIEALAGPSQAGRLIEIARSQGRIDTWTDSKGVKCISRQEERMFGKVVEMDTRPAFVEKANFLLVVAEIAETGIDDASRAGWRKALKERGNLTNRAAKNQLASLLAVGILKDGDLRHPTLTLESALIFLKNADRRS